MLIYILDLFYCVEVTCAFYKELAIRNPELYGISFTGNISFKNNIVDGNFITSIIFYPLNNSMKGNLMNIQTLTVYSLNADLAMNISCGLIFENNTVSDGLQKTMINNKIYNNRKLFTLYCINKIKS